MTNLVIQAAFDVADAVLFGVPSTALMPFLTQKYNFEESEAKRLIAKISSQMNQISSKYGEDPTVIKARLTEAMYNTGPVGDFVQDLNEKYAKVGGDAYQYSRLSGDLYEAQVKLQNLQHKRQEEAGTLGTVVSRAIDPPGAIRDFNQNS